MEGGGQVPHLLHQSLELFLEAGDFRLVCLGDRHQWLVLTLAALELTPGLGQQLFLALFIADKLALALGIELTLALLLVAHHLQQLVEAGDLRARPGRRRRLGKTAGRCQQGQRRPDGHTCETAPLHD